MNFADFKEVHEGDTPLAKLNLLLMAMSVIASTRIEYRECHSPKSREHYEREIRGQEERAEWLYNELKMVLTGAVPVQAESDAQTVE